MVPFPMTLSDLKPTFQGHDIIQRQITRIGKSYMIYIEWCRFERPSVTQNLDFKVIVLL